MDEKICFDDFFAEFCEAIKRDSPWSHIIAEKLHETLLLHDLRLDFDSFEDIIIYDLISILKLKLQAHFFINLDSVSAYLPLRMHFGSIAIIREKFYFPRYTPISIQRAARLIYDNSSLPLI